MRPEPAIESLRAQIEKIEGRSRRVKSVLPFGIAEVDSRLPGEGLALGALHEIAGGGNGAIDGAAAALFAAGIAARTKGKVLWCLTRPDLFAPALAQAGLPPDRVIYVEAGDDKPGDFYHGALPMFLDAGFARIATHKNVTVVRKHLR